MLNRAAAEVRMKISTNVEILVFLDDEWKRLRENFVKG